MNRSATALRARVSPLAAGLAAALMRGYGTTQRFVLLVVLFLAGSLYMFSTAFEQFIDPRNFGGICELAAGIDPSANSAASEQAIGTPGFDYCIELHASGWRYLWLPIAATVLVVLLSVLHYALYPWWQNRRRVIVPVERADPDRVVRKALDALRTRVSAAAPLTYVVDLSAGSSTNARVFGRPRSYTVCLDLGLITQFDRDPDAFEATLLHELFHIRNRDIGITYLTVAIWHVFVLFTLTPFVISQAYSLVTSLSSKNVSVFAPGELPRDAGSIVLVAFLVLLVYLSMADILGVREYSADSGAVDLGADKAHWIRHVAVVPADHGRGRLRARLRSALRPHPGWEMRSAALIRPRPLISARDSSMFATGMAAQLLLGFLEEAPIGISYGWAQAHPLVPSAVLTSAIAGFAVWRDATVELRAGRQAPSGLRAGLWLGLGQLAAALLITWTTASSWSLPWPWPLVLVPLIIMPTAILWWTSRMVALLYGRRGLGAITARAAVIATSTVAFAWSLDTWLTGMQYFYGNLTPASSVFAGELEGFPHTATVNIIATATGFIINLSVDNFGIPLSLALWIIPLFVARPRKSLSSGLWCGLCAAICILFITWRAHGWDGHGILTDWQNYYVYDMWIFAILACAVTTAAIIAGLRCGHDPVAAMTAAAITAATVVPVSAAVYGTDGCISPITVLHVQGCALSPSLNWGDYGPVIFPWLLPWLGMFTLVAAATATVITHAVKYMTIRVDAPDRPRGIGFPAPASGSATLRRPPAGPVLGCLVLCAITVAAYASAAFTGDSADPAASSQGTAAQDSVSPRLLAYEMGAWMYLDGFAITGGITDDTSRLAKEESAGKPSGSAVRSTCSSILSLTQNAQSYLSPPDSSLSGSWESLIGDTKTGAQECIAGLDQHKTSETQAGVYQIYGSIQSLAGFTNQASVVIDAYL